ncbi:hypothetical protein ACOMHN_061635 [Nucella lapillus]
MSRGILARDAIELLCKILKENGMSEIEAEMLRKAKFDRPEACAPLWRLLFELIFFCQHGLMGSGVFTSFIKMHTEDQVSYVKKEMQRRGYLSRSFAALSPAMTAGGSRELLLALAWLMTKESILARFMDHRSSSVISEDVLSLYENEESDQAWKAPTFGEGKAPTAMQRVQQMLVMNNKLKMNLRLLHASQQHFANLTHTIHNSTYGVSLNPDNQHLTSMQTYMLRHPQHMTKVLRLLEEDSERLENLLNWEEKNSVFWEWMESVLELKLQQMNLNSEALASEDESDCGASNNTRTIFLEVPPNIGAEIVSSRRNLMNKILHYESALNTLEELWASKRCTVSEWDLDQLLHSINAEICQIQTSLGHDLRHHHHHHPSDPLSSSSHPPLPSPPPPPHPSLPQWRLVKKALGRQGNVRVSNMLNRQEKDLQEDARSIQDEICRLQEEAEKVEGEVLRLRRHCVHTLTSMLTALPNAVCILPPQLRALAS